MSSNPPVVSRERGQSASARIPAAVYQSSMLRTARSRLPASLQRSLRLPLALALALAELLAYLVICARQVRTVSSLRKGTLGATSIEVSTSEMEWINLCGVQYQKQIPKKNPTFPSQLLALSSTFNAPTHTGHSQDQELHTESAALIPDYVPRRQKYELQMQTTSAGFRPAWARRLSSSRINLKPIPSMRRSQPNRIQGRQRGDAIGPMTSVQLQGRFSEWKRRRRRRPCTASLTRVSFRPRLHAVFLLPLYSRSGLSAFSLRAAIA